jgi:microcystin-dependent protein
MSGFTQNNISVVSPIGSIMAYLGTTSPDGWIICNGVAVVNNDGKYNGLVIMGIGSSSGNNYIPPNLTNYFLHQTNGVIGNTGGSSTVTLTVTNMPAHSHTITSTQAAHTHTQDAHSHSVTNRLGFNDKRYSGGGGDYVGYGSLSTDSQTPKINSATPTITSSAANTGGGSSFSIMPPYYTVNYILKY